MYRSTGYHAFSSDCKWDQNSALRYIVGYKETTSYLLWRMYGYSEVRATSAVTCSLYIVAVR